jgi:hypothetical protein
VSRKNTTICEFCRRGHITKSTKEIAFYQWSDLGRIRCRATISIGVCDVCHARSVDPGADKIFDEAFRREYDRAAMIATRDSRDAACTPAMVGLEGIVSKRGECSRGLRSS